MTNLIIQSCVVAMEMTFRGRITEHETEVYSLDKSDPVWNHMESAVINSYNQHYYIQF